MGVCPLFRAWVLQDQGEVWCIESWGAAEARKGFKASISSWELAGGNDTLEAETRENPCDERVCTEKSLQKGCVLEGSLVCQAESERRKARETEWVLWQKWRWEDSTSIRKHREKKMVWWFKLCLQVAVSERALGCNWSSRSMETFSGRLESIVFVEGTRQLHWGWR